MFRFKLVCDCGYESADAVWGSKLVGGQKFVAVPIFDPDTGTLRSHDVLANVIAAGQKDPTLWGVYINSTIRPLYGINSSPLPFIAYDTPLLVCPKCSRMSCRAISTGIG